MSLLLLILILFYFTMNQQLMPILETLYNASKKTPNQIYMLLIILLILSQDSSFNASIHKMVRICSSGQPLTGLLKDCVDIFGILYRFFPVFHGTKNTSFIRRLLDLYWSLS